MLRDISLLLALAMGPAPLGHSEAPAGISLASAYDCAERSCKALSSCEEACYKLLVCGQTKRDGDGDGIPCENLCSQPCR